MIKKYKNNEITSKNVGEELTLFGWIQNERKFGKLTFIDLRDMHGIIQIVFDNLTSKLGFETILKVKGKVVLRKEKNPNLQSGEIEAHVSEYEVLNTSKELPFLIRDDDNSKEETKLQYRFLDLRKPINTKKIIFRSKFINALRTFLIENDFVEIETPILSKSTPEGARDFLVPTRNKNKFFSLPQSPQLYKQLLMASGFERYFQIARAFRDEDSRKDRQPEFSQLDMEISFQDEKVLHSITEKMLVYAFEKMNIKIEAPFERLSFDYVMQNYGSDKPDLRYEVKIQDLKKYFEKSSFEIISSKKFIKGLFIKEIITKNDFKTLEEIAKKNGANILFYSSVEQGKISRTNFANKDKESVEKIIEDFSIENGTFFIVASDFENKVLLSLGATRVELNSIFKWANKDQYKFAWIIDWPLFEYDENTNTYSPSHHPFTMYDESTLVDGKISYEKTKAKSYDLVLNGYELVSGSVRIYKKEIQAQIFKLLNLSQKEIEDKFGFFLKAFDYGLPPHCGLAFGIERLIMIMTQSESIREVIAFPKTSSGQALMEDAPSLVSEEQLKEVFLKVEK